MAYLCGDQIEIMDNIVVQIENAEARFSAYAFRKPINWTVRENEHWTVIGANGAGKSQLISILLEKQPLRSGNVRRMDGRRMSEIAKYVAFTDIYSIFDAENSYYQQRWNVGDVQTAPFVKELFEGVDSPMVRNFMEIFGIKAFFAKRVNMLSSGELRKMLIVLSLRINPKILILDNPYIGLDVESRAVLDDALISLAQGIQLITLVADPRDVPPVSTHVLPVLDKELLPAMTREQFICDKELHKSLFHTNPDIEIPAHVKHVRPDFNNVLEFRNISIKYGDRTILDGIDWTVKRGEKWMLAGKNGSGKSTLLSLVFCDNPQSYANNVTLFDRKRGVGQSIWEVKSRIGFISPEITNYYRKPVDCLDVVASGFYDTIGIPYAYDDQKAECALQWMKAFGIEHLARRSSLEVSAGEHQMVMLARAFVKDPDLLILDEPMHGLDVENKRRVKEIIKKWANSEKSLIYVTHYEEEAPDIITERLELGKM